MEITVNSSGAIEDIVTNLDPDVNSSEITESRVLVNAPTDIDFSSIVVPSTSSINSQIIPSDPISVNTSTLGQNESETSGSIGANTGDCITPVNNGNLGTMVTTGVNGSQVQTSVTIGVNNIAAEPELIEVLSSAESDSTIIYKVPNAARLAELDKIATYCRRTPGQRFLEMYKTADERVVQALYKSTLERKCCVLLKPISSMDRDHWLKKTRVSTN